MEEQKEIHDIFLTNPIDLLKYVEQFVKVILENGEVIFGTVYTIDPVSQRNDIPKGARRRYVLTPGMYRQYVFFDVRTNQVAMVLVPGSNAITTGSNNLVLIYKEISNELSLKIILKHAITSMEMLSEVPAEQQNIIDNLFNSQCFSSISNAKEDVKNWLLKNMLPVVEVGDKLVIDSVEIHPPYTAFQCYSDNSVVLSRIQKLLEQMPSKES